MENIQDRFETNRKRKYVADVKLFILIDYMYRAEKQLSQPETEKLVTTVSKHLERIYHKIVQLESEQVNNLQSKVTLSPGHTVVTEDAG